MRREGPLILNSEQISGFVRSEDFYHTGVLVEDLDSAIEEFGSMFGYTFRDHVVEVSYRTESGERKDIELRVAYSVQGPPHLELIQAQADTAWAAPDGPHIHHVGFWTDHLAEAIDQAAESGLQPVATGIGPGPEEEPVRFSYLIGPTGIRVELVDSASKPTLKDWLSGGS